LGVILHLLLWRELHRRCRALQGVCWHYPKASRLSSNVRQQ
jgi:hypothetical protein